MEEAASENSASDVTPEADNTVDDQQELSYVNGQGWQYKNYHLNPSVRSNPQLFAYPKLDKPVDNAQNNQGQNTGYQKGYQGRTYILSQAQHNQFQNQKHQTARQVSPAPTTAPQDEMKAAEKGKQKEGEQPRSETAPLSDKETEQPAGTYPAHAATPIEPVPTREYTPKVHTLFPRRSLGRIVRR
ncbi:hypothetical protein F2Q70_00003713 [Brassica cretica]|uniref:Uncharacterized protein n=1 Tax=Brassica cretica TaxID=69181 RepID=A0A8S9J0V7_BRACR|nr:hypothetical protein F2Q70_00003713 [Brassica cretica]